MLSTITTDLEKIKANNHGKIPYGVLTEKVREYQKEIPWVNIDMVKNHLKKLNKFNANKQTMLQASQGITTSTTINSATITSSLTLSDPLLNDGGVVAPSDDALDYLSSNSSTALSHISTTRTASSSSSAAPSSLPTHAFGRPKGTTLQNNIIMKRRIEVASEEAATRLSQVLKRTKVNNQRAAKGALTKIINECKVKHGIPCSLEIKKETIRSRVKRGKHKGGNKGHTSPMIEIEPYLVEIIGQLASMRVPITCKEGLSLANSIIKNTTCEESVAEWKAKFCRSVDNNPCREMSLGIGYWRGFMKRNGHLIKAKKGVKFDAKRADWCTHRNFEEMYAEIYQKMVEKGIATKMEQEMAVDREGNIVDDESSDRFGRKTSYKLDRPDKLVFVDEVGSNTNQEKDGNKGGEKYLTTREGRALMRCNTKDAHFSVLGFTAATGEPIMCAIIFAAKQLDPLWITGLDPFAAWEGGERELEQNSGEGKMLPQGPECVYNGKVVPTFIGCSESGSITSELLAAMLKKMDEADVFKRSIDGISPFLILDGHGSRFEMPFLKYILDEEHIWNVCVGVPYGTSFWQVGDSPEQNGCFKMYLAEAKKKLFEQKEYYDLPGTIEKTDVVKLVRYAWSKSFAKVNSNKKAICERGWNPLNYNILLHPELQENGAGDYIANSNIGPEQLNLTQGISGSLTEKIVAFKNREAARSGANATEMIRRRRESAKEAIAQGRRITAGKFVSAGNYAIGPECLRNIQERQQMEEQKRNENMVKLKEEFDALLAQVGNIRMLNKSPEQWTVPQLKTMVKWFKRDGDAALPSQKQHLLTRYYETCNREERSAPPLPPPIEMGDEHDDDNDVVINEEAI
jgi:hypothetical protein